MPRGRSVARPVRKVISSSLCDDVLDRLRPTLPAPGTCDLIDVNPGDAFWSKKLHEVLQPARHIFVAEPPEKHASDEVRRLCLEQPDKFRHVNGITRVMDNAGNDLSEFATRTPYGQLNPSLLVNMNLSGPSVEYLGHEGSRVKLYLHWLYTATLGNLPDFHRYGLLRVLAWVPGEETNDLVPKMIYDRRRLSLRAEAHAEIRLVAAPPVGGRRDTWERGRRWYGVDREARPLVQERAKELGVATPENRRLPPVVPSISDVIPTPELLRSTNFTSAWKWTTEFRKLDDLLRAEDPEWYETFAHIVPSAGRPSPKLPLRNTPERRRYFHLLNRARTQHAKHMDAIEIVLEHRALWKAWRETDLTFDGNRPRLDAHAHDLLARTRRLMERLNEQAKDNMNFARKTIDDFLVFDSSPPVMAWNRRPYEPLLVHDDEFEPSRRPLALVDITPRSSFTDRIDNVDKAVCFDYCLRMLCDRIGAPVSQALAWLVPGGTEQFIDTIEGIKDPKRGGFPDLDLINLRTLPADLFVEIALAFERWPFRKDTEYLSFSVKQRVRSKFEAPEKRLA